ncbi:HlyD family secretion protein [Aquibium microcysteis]|uniref:HlyD family secretion protein n=1 Tax=Aquibium microcysteis TaxID=675281 RepID=UPI001EF3CE8F|nr:HlyD family secretion protein [Aquibium microcysteis]
MTMKDASRPAPAAAPAPPRRRRGLRTLLMLSVPLALIGGGGYVWVTGGRFQETENASLRQPRVTVAAEIAGRVTEVKVVENMAVTSGETLFVIDPEPYRIALDQANAALEGARLQVEQLRAAYGQAITQEAIARDSVVYLQSELDRKKALTDKGIGTQSALDTARHDLATAREQQAAAGQGIASARAALGGDPNIETDRHPTVLAALAARDKAAWQLGLTTVRAPADGVVSQASSFKPGQMVSPGTSLFTLVETDDPWIEANFKETQLTHMRVGQAAEVRIDAFPDVPLHATVQSIGAGTGAEFSLLPAQNATGNWVKVTQRVPVRLELEDDEIAGRLRTGMSATVEVDTRVERGLPAFASLFGTVHAAE